ncbi:MAG: TolC family protein [Epsilonproteobacteria bacterium]|nr:TolC family protein [Campylobacterota bacterium]
MYKHYLLLSIFAFTHLSALDTTLLTADKQKIFEQKKRVIEANAKQLKYNWVSPLNLSSSVSSSESVSDMGYNASIQLNQDIYRSGGIGESMSYADSKLAFDLLSLELENATLYQALLVGLLELKKLNLTLDQAEYQFKNSEIEVFLKSQQYKTGNVDITEMNEALMNKNSILKTILTTKESIIDKEIALKKLTSIPLNEIKVSYFRLLSQEEFIQNNFTVLQAKLESKLAGTEYAIKKTDYLPTLSLNGQVGYQDTLESNSQTVQDNEYHSLGLTLSMPLDFNSKSALEEQEANYLQSRIEVSDVEAEERALYEQSMNKIKNYQEHNRVTATNMNLYAELIDVTNKGFKAGYKTGYDLQTLQNTKVIDELEIEINEINIEITQAKLHFASNLGEKYYER